MNIGAQKLQLDDAARELEIKINRLQHDRLILLAAMRSIDENQENILEQNSILAQEAVQILRRDKNR